MKILKRGSLLLVLGVLLCSLFIVTVHAANRFFWAPELVGVSGALDGINGNLLTDGDMAIVGRDNSGIFEGYLYRLEDYASNPPDESVPDTIAPNENAENKRWKLLKMFATGLVSGAITLPITVPGGDLYLMNCNIDGSCGWTDPASIVGAGITLVQITDLLIPEGVDEDTHGFLMCGYENTGNITMAPCGEYVADNTTTGKLVKKVVTLEVPTLEDAVAGTDYALPNADTTGTASKLPVDVATDATGKESVDSTTGQYRTYDGTRQNVFSPIQSISFVITAPAAADDINIMKAPYGMSILGIDCIVQGTTSATGQIQECGADGTSCADLDSDIACDADGAADDGGLTDSTIASGAWLRWKTTSLSGTPTFLTVTVRYRVVAD